MTSPSRFTALALLAVAAAMTTACASLSLPFSDMKNAQMTVYRLQNYEPQQAQAQAQAPAQGGFQLPPQIQQWVQAGASLLPRELIPPGLLTGATPPPPAPPDAPRFHGFRILEWQPVNDASVKSDIVDTFGHASNFTNPQSNCAYAEIGFAIAQPNNPTPADILVSLSCQQVQAFNFAWPYQQTGITPDTEKKFAQIEQKVFAGR
jgi:hypothetical protein